MFTRRRLFFSQNGLGSLPYCCETSDVVKHFKLMKVSGPGIKLRGSPHSCGYREGTTSILQLNGTTITRIILTGSEKTWLELESRGQRDGYAVEHQW